MVTTHEADSKQSDLGGPGKRVRGMVVLAVRFHPEVYAGLRDMAREEHRTMSQQVAHLVARSVKERGAA
jgi:hypothetical protein